MSDNQTFREVIFDPIIESGEPFTADTLRDRWRSYQKTMGQRPSSVTMLNGWIGVCISRARLEKIIVLDQERQQWKRNDQLL